MYYSSAQNFIDAPARALALFGMSGVGKTYLSNLMRDDGWFHYSVDYRIGTRYLGEYIVDNFKHEAMKNPFLAKLLRTDSIYISSNITFENLDPLSTYLGKPGNEAKGGIPFEEYQKRQAQHCIAEAKAMADVPHFIDRAKSLYGYDNFICDTSGSLGEVADGKAANDPILKHLADHTALIYIRGTDDHVERLIERFASAPKPMYYQPEFLIAKWAEFKTLKKIKHDADVDPDEFAIWGFKAILYHRLPRYQAIADNFGYTIDARDVEQIKTGEDFIQLIATAISMQA